MRVPWARLFLASVVAGVLTGVGDTLLVLATNPDTGVVSYRFAYALGPLAIGGVWAAALGVAVGIVFGGRGGPAMAVGAVSAVWVAGFLLAGRGAGQRGLGLVVLTVLVAVAGVGLARLALDATELVGRLGRCGRRRVGLGFAAMLLVALASLGLAWTSAFTGGTGPCPSPNDGPGSPNVILISVDALRADAARGMKAYRRLAERGIEFTQHTTASPWTLPAVASLLTGLPLAEHGAGRSRSWRSLVSKSALPGTIPTLAGRLAVVGYRTHAIVTNPFLTAQYGIDQGFCSFENVSMAGETARAFAHTTPLRLLSALAPAVLPSDRARVVRRRAERWLAENARAPFFLWLHFLDPHAPYGDRDGTSTSLTLDLMAFQHRDEPVAPFRAIGLLRAGEYRPGPAERERIEALYREDVAYVDGEIERLLDTIDARGLSERTAIVFTSDHGEEFWEHGSVEHGRTLFEEVMRVPLVIVPPGGRLARLVQSDLTSVIDVAPTILSLAGVTWHGLPGVDLLGGPATPERVLALGNLLFGEEWVAVRTPRLKYALSEHGEERLYDLAEDPLERVNRVVAAPVVAKGKRGALRYP